MNNPLSDDRGAGSGLGDRPKSIDRISSQKGDSFVPRLTPRPAPPTPQRVIGPEKFIRIGSAVKGLGMEIAA
jgi:hypothetical protein